MTAPVQTAGPADPNGGLRAKVYAGIGAIGSVAAFLQTIHLISDAQAASITAVGSNAATLIASVGVLFAAFKTRGQVKNGTFDAPPAPEPVDTKTVVTAGLQELADQAASSVGVLNEVTQVAASVLPGLAPAVANAATAVEKAIADFAAAR